MLATLFPAPAVVFIWAAFIVAQGENFRWCRMIDNGYAGRSQRVQAFAFATSIAACLFGFTFIVSFGFDQGWMSAIGLIVVSIATSILWSSVDNNPLFWILGTFAVWPVIIVLAPRTSWFGLL